LDQGVQIDIIYNIQTSRKPSTKYPI